MNIHCIFCDTPAVIRNQNILMKCMCDDDFRTASIEQIKYGFHDDKVYLLDNQLKGSDVYEKKNSRTSLCNME